MSRVVRITALCAVLALLGFGRAAASHYPIENVLPADVAAKLDKAGIKTTEDLLKKGARPAGRRKLAKATGIALGKLLAWVRMCDLLRIRGIGPTVAQLLGKVKITSIAQLKRQSAKRLHPRLVKANNQFKIMQKMPSVKHLVGWIGQAKRLKVIVR